MTQIEELKAEMSELRSRIDGLYHENAKLHEALANVKVHATDSQTEGGETPTPTKQRLFWAFLRGMGSVLEVFPVPGRFDRWINETVPDNEFAMLFRELCLVPEEDKPGNGAGS